MPCVWLWLGHICHLLCFDALRSIRLILLFLEHLRLLCTNILFLAKGTFHFAHCLKTAKSFFFFCFHNLILIHSNSKENSPFWIALAAPRAEEDTSELQSHVYLVF